jgi:hypothetical protein
MDKILHRLLVFLDQLGERRAVAPLHAEHQDGVRIRLDWHPLESNERPARNKVSLAMLAFTPFSPQLMRACRI